LRHDGDAALEAYIALRRARPDLFDLPGRHGAGAIEILSDPADIEAARAAAAAHRAAHALPAEDTRVGVLASDPYMLVLRDPVRFPDGSLGLYNRIIEGRSVAAIPLLGDKIVLLRIFRHGMRSWSLEFPRGGCDRNETPEAAIRREIAEEIGAKPREIVALGSFTPGGSILSIIASLFAVRIDAVGRPDSAEGISGLEVLGMTEVEARIRSGEILDGFTMGAFLRARLAGLI
jgi:ADP-ribose pyrophosphatase